MRLSLLIACVVPALTLACCDTRAQPPKPAPEAPAAANTNAADAYKAIFPKVTRDLGLAAGEVRFTAKGVEVAKDSPNGPWSKIEADLKAQQPVIADLMNAAAIRRCDFGLKAVDTDAAVTIGGKFSAAGRILRADAARLWTTGDTNDAVERLVALYRMSAHLSREPVVITALVNAALIQLANDTARTMAAGAAGHSLTADQGRKLLAALDRLDAKDPAGVTRAKRAQTAAPDPKMLTSLAEVQSRLMDDLARTRDALKKP
jgi:hypothetical protein